MPELVVCEPELFFPPTTTLRVFTFSGSAPLDASDYGASTTVATSGTFATDVVCGDLDANAVAGNPRADVVVVHAGSGDVELLYDVDPAAPSNPSPVNLAVGLNPVAAAVGDLDGDCAEDVVVANQGSGDLSVHLGTVAALTEVIGTGCAGTGGLVPQISGIGTPSLNSTFGIQLSQARAFAPVLAMFSAGQFTTTYASCELYLGAPVATVLRFADGDGENSLLFGIPDDESLLCLDVWFQHAVFDPAGAISGLALTNGLRVQVGR